VLVGGRVAPGGEGERATAGGEGERAAAGGEGERATPGAAGEFAAAAGPPGMAAPTRFVPAVRVDTVVDATGAGDAFAGTVAARLALGADLIDAVREGVTAAARSLGARGGTGWVTDRGGG
jgi:2-dehydro-3-deoxygluconokinase